MRQIPADELAFIIKFELGKLGKATLRDMASGHGDTRRMAVSIAAGRRLHRMRDWEIIVPDGLGAPVDTNTFPWSPDLSASPAAASETQVREQS